MEGKKNTVTTPKISRHVQETKWKNPQVSKVAETETKRKESLFCGLTTENYPGAGKQMVIQTQEALRATEGHRQPRTFA